MQVFATQTQLKQVESQFNSYATKPEFEAYLSGFLRLKDETRLEQAKFSDE